MAPCRWPSTSKDLMLATEVAGRRPKCAADWEEIDPRLSIEFSTENRAVKLTGRACRERLDPLLKKYAEDDNSETQSIVQNAIWPKFGHIMIVWLILFLVTRLNTQALGFQILW